MLATVTLLGSNAHANIGDAQEREAKAKQMQSDLKDHFLEGVSAGSPRGYRVSAACHVASEAIWGSITFVAIRFATSTVALLLPVNLVMWGSLA